MKIINVRSKTDRKPDSRLSHVPNYRGVQSMLSMMQDASWVK